MVIGSSRAQKVAVGSSYSDVVSTLFIRPQEVSDGTQPLTTQETDSIDLSRDGISELVERIVDEWSTDLVMPLAPTGRGRVGG